MKLTWSRVVGVVFLSGVMITACDSDEQDSGESEAGNLQQVDKDFLMRVTSFSRAQIRTGSLAEGKGHLEAVREFGAEMVDEHQQGLDELKEIAGDPNYSRAVLWLNDSEETEIVTVLDTLEGTEFDNAYLKNEIAAHGRSESFYKTQITKGKNKRLIRYAEKMLPIARARQVKADSIKTSILHDDYSAGRVTKPIKK